MSALQRFIDNTIDAFMPEKEYSAEQVIENLKRDIRMLSDYIMNNTPDTKVWREKAQRLKEKKEELEKIEQEN